jgi:hypothetical protein
MASFAYLSRYEDALGSKSSKNTEGESAAHTKTIPSSAMKRELLPILLEFEYGFKYIVFRTPDIIL